MVARVLLWHTKEAMNVSQKALTFTPAMPFTHFLSSMGIGKIEMIAFGIIFMIWIIFTIISAYHWIRYNYRSVITLPMIALHIFISFSLIMYAWSGIAI